MMKSSSVRVALIFCISGMMAQASTLDQVRQLWNPQGVRAEEPDIAAQPVATTPSAWYRLSNGQQVNLAQWKVVLFMQGHCPYCHQFDPVLKSLSERVGFGVMAYTLDAQGDTAFPEALPAPPEVMKTFFPNLPVATPTTFLVNVNTLEALPLLQGATDEQGFMARVDTVLQMRAGGRN
ncbi:type-F conjugative transfer system pilin assembly thiol-disulfide isomerase TrbB [Buttiauxella ferragutiae]|uniref:type-F conjugative transfer system pilin assembly thiol-disulfide isomerase TrbB n=1 Tax=Buttiauxella ferragutiae TaxID=82989 RepID=UPI003524DEE7